MMKFASLHDALHTSTAFVYTQVCVWVRFASKVCPFTCCSIFERDPTAKELFKDVNVADMDSPEFEAHMLRIINGVSLLVNFMQDTPALTAAVKHMADQHASRHGVTAFQFQVEYFFYWNGHNLCVHQLLRLYLRGTPSLRVSTSRRT